MITIIIMMLRLTDLNRDVFRLILVNIPYASIVSIVSISRLARSIIKKPTFWQYKASHDFPRANWEPVDKRFSNRIRYLEIWAKNETCPQILKYIRDQRRSRFGNGILPKLHDWSLYGQTNLSRDQDENNTKFFACIGADGTPIDLLLYSNRYEVSVASTLEYFPARNLTDFKHFITINNPDNPLPTTQINMHDIIHLDPKESCLFYVSANGVKFCENIFPHEALEMFAKHKIHSVDDIHDLYDIDINDRRLYWLKIFISHKENESLWLCENEDEYQQCKDGCYHESKITQN
jgi:hypothetical protein